MKRIRVVIADDHPVVRAGTRRILQAEPDIEIVGEATDGEEAIRLGAELCPDVVLLDLRIPKKTGIQVILGLRDTDPQVRIIAMSPVGTEPEVREAIELGVQGYLPKSAPLHEIVDAVRAVYEGSVFIRMPAYLPYMQMPRRRGQDLPTARELEVLELVAKGNRTRDIATTLYMTERTVQFHLGNLFAKSGAGSRTELVYVARHRGWLS